MARSVDLPAPFGPTRRVSVPRLRERDTPATARSPPNSRTTSAACSTTSWSRGGWLGPAPPTGQLTLAEDTGLADAAFSSGGGTAGCGTPGAAGASAGGGVPAPAGPAAPGRAGLVPSATGGA